MKDGKIRSLPLAWVFGFTSLFPALADERPVGADVPWSTYQAEDMTTNGEILGPRYEALSVERESAGQRCVRLTADQFVEFAASTAGNALVIRYSLPDSPDGRGLEDQLRVSIDGKTVSTLKLSSKLVHVYGKYPFTNHPAEGEPRYFYDEARLKVPPLAEGARIRLEKLTGAAYCIIDLVDIERVPPAASAPANALSVLSFGAVGTGEADDTDALRKCVAAAAQQGKVAWVPAGDYRITGDIVLTAPVEVRGAGMWYTNFIGDDTLYDWADRRVRFKISGSNIHLADFSIIGKLRYRNDGEPNDGVVGAGCDHSSVERVWIEHTKVGIWLYNATKLTIDGCRMRNLLADGVNLCVGTTDTTVQNSSTRGTGDDCFAIWPTVSDQGYVQRVTSPGRNVIRRCTGEAPFMANGAAIYGGAGNRVEDCLFTDVATAAGVLISTTFPTSDETLQADNNFSGLTVVENCRTVRCGGRDDVWGWRGSVQVCLDHRNISGLSLRGLVIEDSLSDGVTIIGPGSAKGQGTLSNARLEEIMVGRCSVAESSRPGLFIRADARGGLMMAKSAIAEIRNDSEAFALTRE